MRSEVSEIVTATFVEIVEQLTFMLGDQVDKDELTTPDSAILRAAMEFSGDATGSLDLIIAEEACPELAANILGIDTDEVESQEQVLDAFKETLNVVGGRVVREIGGSDLRFDLTPPAIQNLGAEAWAAFVASPSRIGFLLDETPVLFGIEFESEGT
ncbi:MAG: chemotaxis protein CheX [bacterium]|nr:chemotaxis protein CheX [bacterium]